VQHGKSNTLLHELCDLIQMGNDEVTRTTVGVDNYRGGIFENVKVLGPTLMDYYFDAIHMCVERICEEFATCGMLVGAAPMTGTACNENDS
jgi:hypothetical protein